jgi:Fur family ferric uptake transcriptional regulator
MNKTDRLTAALLEASERNTRPRQAIARAIAALGEKGGAFSVEELIKELGRAKSRIGRATVYRTIEKLAGLKVLDRIEFADGARAYRLCDSEKHHHHLTCTSCHRVVEFDLCIPQAKIDAIGRRESFTIEDHEISLYGLCAKCRGKPEAPAR